MKTEKRMAVDPTTEAKYEIELPTSEAVKQEILKLDYPSNGITIKEATEKLAEKFGLSDEQKAAQTKRGKRYLGFFHYEVVGAEFKKLLREGKLKQPEGRGKPYVPSGKIPPSPSDGDIEDIYQQIRKKVAEDLLQEIKANSPAFFENLVINLLVEMGYGGSREDAEAVGRSGDGGIDGIINEDRLGLDVIYVQAKRWTGNVGEPPVRDFVGALDGAGVQKGIFITTSDFHPAAKRFAERSSKRIILINGHQLAQLMIEHDVGVSTVKTYEIKRVDSDYFIEDIG